MVESSKDQLEDFEDDEEVGTHKGKSREKNRTKHSETEQRRRSKINERFQLLRDLIPQNDQKRDKASFLLEVIEYVQFLQEKINMYEGSYQGWSSEPRKLIPWKNDHVTTEGLADPSQVIKNGPLDLQTNVLVSPSMIHNSQNSLESDVGSAMVYKTLDNFSGSVTQSVQINPQQSNMFDPIENCAVLSQPLRETVSDIISIDPLPRSNPEPLHSGHTKNGSVCISNSYSQGVLNTLTQALQSSGADMSQTSISVQIDVASRTNCVLTSMASGLKDHVNRSLNNQVMASSPVTSSSKCEQAHKRVRLEQ